MTERGEKKRKQRKEKERKEEEEEEEVGWQDKKIQNTYTRSHVREAVVIALHIDR